MRDAGIEVRPLREITGRAMFNEVFLDDVFVPDDCVVGRAWRRLAGRAHDAGDRASRDGARRRARRGRRGAAAGGECGGRRRCSIRSAPGWPRAWRFGVDDRLAAAIAAGEEAGQTAAVRKLLGVAHRQAVAETARALHGAQGAAADGAAADAVDSFLLTRCLSIAGGTTQILLSLVAERVLGLPRDETR